MNPGAAAFAMNMAKIDAGAQSPLPPQPKDKDKA